MRYMDSNRQLVVSTGDTLGRSPGPPPSKLHSLPVFGFGDGQPSTGFAYSNEQMADLDESESDNPHPSNNCGGGFQPPLELYASLVQAQESYLRSLQARTEAPDVQLLWAEIDRAHEKQSQASRDMLRQIFPGVDSESVLESVLEGSEGHVESSVEMLLEITSGG